MPSPFIWYSFGNRKTLWSSLQTARDSLKRVSFYTLSMDQSYSIIFEYNFLWFSLFVYLGAHSTVAYDELIGKIELFNKVLCFGLFVTIALLLLTVVPYTLVRYHMFNMGEESFYLFLPVWFVFYQRLKIIDQQMSSNQWKLIALSLNKVSIQLEDIVWLFGGMAITMRWLYIRRKYLRSIFEPGLWIMLALYSRCWRHWTRCGCIQHRC